MKAFIGAPIGRAGVGLFIPVRISLPLGVELLYLCGVREHPEIVSTSDPPSLGPRFYFWSVFTALEFLFFLIMVLSYHKEHIQPLVCLYLISFLPFLLILCQPPRATPSTRTILVTGLIFRVTLLASFPVFSDDVFRYLFEGKMQIHGLNPYLIAPADPVTLPLRDALFHLINHKSIPTIYPPLSELFFRAAMAIADNLYFFKALLILLDLGVLFFLHRMLKYREFNRQGFLIWAWHPLIIVEIAGSGHQDILGIFFLTGTLFFMQQRHLLRSALMLIGSFLSKLFPLALFPLLLRKKNRWPYLVLFFLTMVFYLPFLYPDAHIFSGLAAYTRTWESNASVFYVLKRLLGDMRAAKIAIGVIFLAVYLYSYRSVTDFESACFMVLGGYLILSPTLHPWYLLWILPFLVLRAKRAWLYLSMASVGYYQILIDYFEKNHWHEQLWIKSLIYIPFFVFLVIEHLKWRRISNASHPV